MDTTLTLRTSLCSRNGPTPLSSAVEEYLQAQMLTFCYDETRCIQVQSSNVAAVIVWLIPIFAHNEGSDGKNGEAKDWELG